MKARTVRIRMLGNHRTYVVGESYDVPEGEANELTGLGIATIETAAAAPAEEGEE